jgi:lambda family phage tail tape measure protein
MAVIGSLSVKLGLVTVEWDKATAQAKKQAKDLQTSFNGLGIDLKNLKNTFNAVGGAMGLSLAGIGALTKATIDFAGQIEDISKSYDVSISKVLQFQAAIVAAGGKTEDAGKIMGTMFTKIAEAQDGNESAIATFEQLGISFAELKNLTPEESIRRVYEGLANIGNTYERIKAVREILGKGGLGKSVEEIAQALGESSAKFKQQEESLKRLADLGDSIDATYKNLKLAIADLLAPFSGADGKALVNVETFKAAMVALTAVGVVGGMFRLVAAFKALNVALRTTASLGVAISAAGGIKGIAMAGAGLAAYFGAKKAFEAEAEEAENASEAPTGTPTANTPASSGDSSGRREIAAGQAKIKLAKELMDIERRRNEYKLAAVRGDKHNLELAEVQLKFEEEMAKAANEKAQALNKSNLSSAQRGLIEQEYQQKVLTATQKEKSDRELINAQRDRELELMMQQAQFAAEMEVFSQRREELEGNRYKMSEFDFRIAQERLKLEQKLLELDQRKREALDAAGGQKFDSKYVDQKNVIDAMIEAEKKLVEVRIGNIESERERQRSFSEGWNAAFRQFSEDAENYARVGGESFNAVVSNMNSAIDSFVRTGKFSFKDFAKSIIQDLIAIQLKMQAMQLFKMAIGAFGGGFGGGMTLGGAADGGFINSPTIVGEHGAELFIPNRQGGTVIPNQQLSGMGAGQPQVVYNGTVIQNMNAIDTQSAAQFIARNKDAVYAANLSASRSLPASR